MRPEDSIQSAICNWIAVVAPAVIVYACPNAARRAEGGHATNAVPGLLKGVFDLALVLPDGRSAFIECKTAKGWLSDDQKRFRERLIARGIPHVIARGIDDVRAAFDAWGVATREHRPAAMVERAEAAT